MLVAIISTFLSTLGQQTIGRIFPISINVISNCFYRPSRTGIVDVPSNYVSCYMLPPLPMTDRTEFNRGRFIVYGYLSTGGVLVK